MPISESGTTRSEIHRTFSTRLTELARLGVNDLIFEHGNPTKIGGDGLHTESNFLGEPTVIILAWRNMQEGGIFWREAIMLKFDGTELVINGAHQVFFGQIPVDEAIRNKIIGEAITQAFNDPKRITKIIQFPRQPI